MEHIKKKIKKLRKNLLKYEYYYHSLKEPIVSDAEYDYLLNQLYNLELKHRELITSDSPTQKIGLNIANKFQKIRHFSPMLSLENTFDISGYLIFEKRIKKLLHINKNITVCCELKIDGIAISIIYEEGVLSRASTRGNGYQGENLTSNIKMIESIPLQLKGEDIPKRLEVRGEVFMLKSDFFNLNKNHKMHKNKYFSNPRNATAGSLRYINPNTTLKRKLMFYCYECFGFDQQTELPDTQYARLIKCLKWGLPVNKEIMICSNDIEVFNFYKQFNMKRSSLNFDIDGIVVKVNSINLQRKLGYNKKSPKWAIALKFPAAEKITKLKDVKFQVGRTGVITPVAYFDPIFISGVVIKKSSLYNKNEIERLDLHYNDYIIVCRSGDVIPKILNVIKNNRSNNAKKVTFPKFCPVCKTTLLENTAEKTIRCHFGLMCNAQKKKSLYHFFSKKCLNVIGLGPKIVDELVNKKYVNSPMDFFNLTEINLSKLKNIGEKKSKYLIKSLKQSRKITLNRFIYALGIPSVGEVVADNLANHFLILEKLISSSFSELISISGIGKIIAYNIINYFSIKYNCSMMIELKNSLEIYNVSIYKKNSKNTYFFGKKIVLTGTFQSFSRSQLRDTLTGLGAKVINNISDSVDVLIYGRQCGIKFLKAKHLNIKMINERYLTLLLLNNSLKN